MHNVIYSLIFVSSFYLFTLLDAKRSGEVGTRNEMRLEKVRVGYVLLSAVVVGGGGLVWLVK